MLRLGYKAACVSVALSMMLTGCAAGGNDPNLSPAENQLRQVNQRFNQTVGEGALAGAALGGLAGLALGGRNRGQAALIGAAAGGALGAGAGYMVARNNLNRASTEADYNQAIAQAASDAEAYRQAAVASQQIAAQADSETQRLRGQLRANQISQQQYTANLARYREDAQLMNKQAGDARRQAAAMRNDAGSASGTNRVRLLNIANSIDTSAEQQEATAARLSRMLASY